ncbi:MAG: hypothetical protein QM754_18290 [Tepidisphaeraceae bacterium]
MNPQTPSMSDIALAAAQKRVEVTARNFKIIARGLIRLEQMDVSRDVVEEQARCLAEAGEKFRIAVRVLNTTRRINGVDPANP